MHLWYSDGKKITGVFPLKENTQGKQGVVCRGTLEQCMWHLREGEYRIKPDDSRLKPVAIDFAPGSMRGEARGILSKPKGEKTMNRQFIEDVLIGLGMVGILYLMVAK